MSSKRRAWLSSRNCHAPPAGFTERHVRDNPCNAPEPDIVVLRRPDLEIADSNPQATDIALVVEIAHTSLSLDLGPKAVLYARAGIADYWVVDINAKRVIVHREPLGPGYRSVAVYSIDESVSPIEQPAAEIPVRVCFRVSSYPKSTGRRGRRTLQ